MRARFTRITKLLGGHLPWLAPLLAALVTLPAALYALYALTYAVFGRDQGIFQYVGWALRNGQRAYRDFQEINGPLPHAWNVLLQGIGGEDEHVFRSIDTAFVVIVYAAAAYTLPRWLALTLPRRTLAMWALAGLAVLGAQFARYDWWHANQREGFYAAIVLASLALQAAAHHTRAPKHATLLFAIAATATTLTWFGKPPCVVFALMQAAVLVVDRDALTVSLKRALAASAAGGAVAALVMVLFVAAYGDFGAAVRVLSKVPLLHHTIWNHSLADSYRAYDNGPRLDWALATTAGFLVAYFLFRLPRRALLALILPVGGFIVFAGQGKGFPYHLHMVTLGTCVMQLVILLTLAQKAEERRDWLAVVVVVLSLLLGFKSSEDARLSRAGQSDWPSTGSTKEKRESHAYLDRFEWGDYFVGDLHDAAKFVREKTSPEEKVQTYGLDPYFMFLAKRHTATPVIYNFELNVDPALEGGSGAKPTAEQRSALLAHRDATEKMMLERMTASPPAAFVFFDKAPFGHPDDGEADFAKHCPDLHRFVDERYAPAERFGTVRVRLLRR